MMDVLREAVVMVVVVIVWCGLGRRCNRALDHVHVEADDENAELDQQREGIGREEGTHRVTEATALRGHVMVCKIQSVKELRNSIIRIMEQERYESINEAIYGTP